MAKPRINSKNKGSEYERKIAKILGRWWGESFHRTPASGGLHWQGDNRVAGDIVTPPDSRYPYVTELKKRESWEFEQVLKGTGEVEKWWEQVSADAERTGLRRLLIFSKNFSPNYAMMSRIDFTKIAWQLGLRNKDIDFNLFVIHKVGQEDRVIFIVEDLIKHVTRDDILKAYGLDPNS